MARRHETHTIPLASLPSDARGPRGISARNQRRIAAKRAPAPAPAPAIDECEHCHVTTRGIHEAHCPDHNARCTLCNGTFDQAAHNGTMHY